MSLANHLLCSGLADDPRSAQIDLLDLVIVFKRRFIPLQEGIDGRVAHEEIEPAPSPGHLVHHGDDLLWLAHVGLDRECISPDLFDHVHCRTGVAGGPIVHADKCTFFRQSNCGRLPDPFGGAGDQGHLAFETVLCHLSCLFSIADRVFAWAGWDSTLVMWATVSKDRDGVDRGPRGLGQS